MKRVIIISRQANKPTRDIRLLADELNRRDIKHKVLTKNSIRV